MFVGSYNGQIEFHDHPFNGVVPVPAALPLMASALVGLGMVKRFRHSKDADLAA